MTKRIQFDRILCPVDFSVFSSRALRHASALAQRFGSRLTVLHVIPQWAPYAPPTYIPAPVLAQPELVQLIRQDLAQFIAEARQSGQPVETLVREADPWREIVMTAEDLRSDLIVMGTHGRGGFEQLLMGSVAEKVLRRAPCTVRTVCQEEGRTWEAPGLVRNIVCATDLTPESGPTLRYALSLASEFQATLTVVHVLDRFAMALSPEYAHVPITTDVMTHHQEQALRDLRAAIPADAREWCTIVEQVVPGRARDEILRLAAQQQADLIVMGARRQGALARTLLGSTSHDVVRAASCPVLTVRADPAEAGHVSVTADVVGSRM
jgi:nucleotide-binding universal stress UspA family protein